MARFPEPAGGAGASTLAVRGLRGGQVFERQDRLADEVPVALEFNGISHAVMLVTPADLEDFAVGFSLSEGLAQHADQLYSVEAEPSELGITLHCEIASEAFARLKEHRRTLAGRTGCGLCGTESLAQVMRELPPLAAGARLEPAAIAHAMAELSQYQVLQKATGATHAAAWCTRDGAPQWLREDVGRHNALDKLIGALARQRIDASQGFIAITSRASFEMVQKAAAAGVPLLAAVSAPTSMAVATAERAGLCLVGFARGQDLVVYSHAERLALQD